MFIAVGTFSTGTCRVIPPAAKPTFPGQALFIATDAAGFGRKLTADDTRMPFIEGFAIARVQEHFWGLPWWSQRYVLLWRPLQWRGEAYFYDGERPAGLLTEFLPIVIFNYCSRTNLVSNAEIDLRVLKDGPSETTGRVVGRVFRPIEGGPRQREEETKVIITGPSGDIVTTTDRKGNYDAPRLAPGIYSVRFEAASLPYAACSSPVRLEPGQIIECDAEVK
jgi:hypothetical protein